MNPVNHENFRWILHNNKVMFLHPSEMDDLPIKGINVFDSEVGATEALIKKIEIQVQQLNITAANLKNRLEQLNTIEFHTTD